MRTFFELKNHLSDVEAGDIPPREFHDSFTAYFYVNREEKGHDVESREIQSENFVYKDIPLSLHMCKDGWYHISHTETGFKFGTGFSPVSVMEKAKLDIDHAYEHVLNGIDKARNWILGLESV